MTWSSSPSRSRRGIALLDAIVGGVMLGIGLTVVLTVASRSLADQADAEKRITASWLADELLSMVLVEGPAAYPQLYDMSGFFDDPFGEFSYEIDIDDRGIGEPYYITAFVRWEVSRGTHEVRVETLIAQRQGEPIQPREPLEPVDRESRYFEDDFDQ